MNADIEKTCKKFCKNRLTRWLKTKHGPLHLFLVDLKY